MGLAIGLLGGDLLEVAVFPDLQEHVLNDLGVFLGGCAAEVVELDLEPVVYVLVDYVELVDELLGSDAFLEGLCLCCGATGLELVMHYRIAAGEREETVCVLFVCAANVECVVASPLVVPREDICAQDGTDEVAVGPY